MQAEKTNLARSMASAMEMRYIDSLTMPLAGVKLLYEIQEASLIIECILAKNAWIVYGGKVHVLPPATLQHTRDRLIALVS